jgi:hypothetical protein
MIYPDANLNNADWPKQTADLHIATRGELFTWLRCAGLSLADFKRSPVYQLAADHWDTILA